MRASRVAAGRIAGSRVTRLKLDELEYLEYSTRRRIVRRVGKIQRR